MSQFWLIRHARPLIDTGVCYGALDIGADAQHTQQSARHWHESLPTHIALLRCSDLKRCVQLKNALLALRPALSSTTDHRLREMNFNQWEGSRWDDVPRDELDAWATDFSHYRPGNGESLTSMLQRVAAALAEDRILAATSQQDIVWITHAGVIRCVQWLNERGTELPLSGQWNQRSPSFGGGFALPAAPAR